MITNKLEDYEVLNILGADLSSTCYKVRHKPSSKIFVWKAVSYNDEKLKRLVLRIEKQKSVKHPCLLKIYDYIIQEEVKILYLVCEFCENNLHSILQKCLFNSQHLNEDFIWQIMYQVACALKIEELVDDLDINNIYIDADLKVKLFNTGVLKNDEQKSKNSIGNVLFGLCTLKFTKPNTNNTVTVVKEILTEFPSYYSNELKEILKFTLLSYLDPKTIIDAILCHPAVLLKAQIKLADIYTNNPVEAKPKRTSSMDNISNHEVECTYRIRWENVKNREAALKMREEKLSEKEHVLHKREKKVALAERTVKDKMLQAELYLKRCREAKSTSSGSRTSDKTPYDNIDTSFSADCGDSTLMAPTSNRLVPQNVRKPFNFTRTMSERKVRFKGHSPLKDMCVRNSFREPKPVCEPNQVGHRSKSRKKLDLLSNKSRLPLVELNKQSSTIWEEGGNGANMQLECRPVSWTEETKQQAFGLLRLMNQKDDSTAAIKHTYL